MNYIHPVFYVLLIIHINLPLLSIIILNKEVGREDIHINFKGIIQSFLKPDIAVRLMSMGFIPGKEIEIIRKSPFGSTWYITMDGKYFALRDTEICAIEFSKLV